LVRPVATSKKIALGAEAETLVCEHLKAQGYAIVARNARVGRLEIDVIARQGPVMVFCEVRARTNDRWMTPAQSIDAGKVRRIRQAAAIWLKQQRPSTTQIRFDAAAVLYTDGVPHLDYFERAF